MIDQKPRKVLGRVIPRLAYPFFSFLMLLLLPLTKVEGQYSDQCSEIDLIVGQPKAPQNQNLNPECFYKQVVVKFQPSEDTLPNLFYASSFSLYGQISNGIISNVQSTYSGITSQSFSGEEFTLTFGNSNNSINMQDSIIVTIETDPGEDFYLDVYVPTPFYLQDAGGGMVSFVTCDRFESGASNGVIYEISPSCSCVPAMPGPDPDQCSALSTTNPGLEFFVDVANATYDGQSAELPIKMRNVHASATITFARVDFKIEIEDIFENLTIGSIDVGTFSLSVNNNVITGTSGPTSYELDSLESISVGRITLEAPINPITGGEAIFDFDYTRVFIEDINGYTGLNHCCKPPGIGDTIQVGDILPCQSPGEPLGFVQVKFAPTVYSTNQLTVPVYVENLTNPSNDVSTDGLTLEIQAITSGDLVLDSTAIANSLYGFPGCSGATIDIDTSAGTVSVEVTGSCGISSGTNNLFKLFFTGTEGCVESIKATIAEFDPNGPYVSCVPPIQVEKPIPCFHQGEIYFYCDTTVTVEGVQICKDSLGRDTLVNCEFNLGACNEVETTGSSGIYSIKGDRIFSNYGITPNKEDFPLCGVSTFDLILITKHILGVSGYTLSPAKRVGADVNNSGSVSTVDIIQIRKLILNVFTEFPDGPEWRFIPAYFDFPEPMTDQEVPYENYDQCLEYPEYTQIDFKAIKIGDVNCSCANEFSSIQDTIEVSVSEVFITGGRKLEFESSDFDDIAAFQFGFDFNSDDWVYEEEIEEDLPDMTSDAIGETLASSGNLKIAWFDTTGRTLSAGEKMLSLEFSDQPWVFGGSLLTELALNETNIPAIAYQEDGTPLVIRLVPNRGGHRLPNPSSYTTEVAETLVQVQPNPTNAEVNFSIYGSKSTPAQLCIFDTQGKKLFEVILDLEIGENNFELKEIANWSTGLYWYQIVIGDKISSGKIVKN